MKRILLLTSFALAACSSVKVATEYDKTANFGGYKTYAFIQRQPGPEQAPANRDPRIREAVIHRLEAGLSAKGLSRVAPDERPDLLVAVHGFATNRIDVQTYGYTYGAVPYGYYGGAAAFTTTDVRQYRDGTLLIDLVDATSHQLVWRGTAQDTFSPGAEAETIANAIDKTLAEYPPKIEKK